MQTNKQYDPAILNEKFCDNRKKMISHFQKRNNLILFNMKNKL